MADGGERLTVRVLDDLSAVSAAAWDACAGTDNPFVCHAFLQALDISCYSFTAVCQRAVPMMSAGASLLTMTYLGAERAIPNYNTMGVAKAALEAATRYIARDLGPKGIRVNAISAGAMRTLSLAGIPGGRGMLAEGRRLSAMKEDTSMEGVAGCALWLLSELGRSTTGEVIHVDTYGNLVTNLPATSLPPHFTVRLASYVVRQASTYADVAPGDLLALIGSAGLLEISARNANAATLTAARRGTPVLVEEL